MKLFNYLSDLNQKKFILFIFSLSLIIRTIYCFYYFNQFGFKNFADDLDYISYANNIIAQGIWVPDISKIYGNGHMVGIGWPFILSLIFRFFGENYFIVFAFNIVLSSAQVVLIYLIGKLVFNKPVAVLASVWAIFYMKFIKYCPSILKENLIHFSMVLVIYLLFRAVREKNGKLLIIFSFIYAFFLHIDERYLILSIVFFFYILFSWGKDWVGSLKITSIYTLILILMIVPWTIRNYLVYKRPVILAFQTSQFTDKLLGYKENKVFNGDEGFKDSYKRKNLPAYEKITKMMVNNDSIPEEFFDTFKYLNSLQMAISRGDTPVTFTPLQNYSADFTEFFRPCRFTPGYIANGYRYMPAWGFINNLVVLFQYGLPLLFFLIYLKNIKTREEYYLLIILIAYTFLHIFLVHAIERYRTPIDFIIILFAFAFFIKKTKKAEN